MSEVTVVDLGGTWRLGWQDVRRGDRTAAEWPAERQTDWLEAVVPGEIHRDLERQGIIEEIEPGLGVLGAQWVDRATWFLVRDLELEEVPASAELVFERLELGATVFVNGVLVERQMTAFVPMRVDVTHELRQGSNRLRVELESGQRNITELPAVGYRRSVSQGPDKRHWLRTGQSQFGWDWSPRLLTLGITGPVRLEAREAPVRLDHVVPLVELSPDHREATVTTRVFVVNNASSPLGVRVEVRLGDLTEVRDVIAQVGETRVEVVTRLDHPRLWWPRGMGEQALYPLHITLADSGGALETRRLRLGLRSVDVDQSPVPDGGSLFRLVVNGVPFFAKGANWVPISLTPNPVPTDLLERQLDRAAEAGFTFLRVWGGGDYESEAFYDGCDERGIVVWQDLVFACNRYPLRVDWYRELVETEVRHHLRRLAAHPSLAVWCGNNEIAWIGQSDIPPGPLVPLVDAVGIEEVRADHAWFEEAAAVLAAREDPTRFYWPSSPWSPTDADSNASHEGDQHPWSIGFTDVDFRKYRLMDDRFPNEGGLLGPSSIRAIYEALPEGQRHYGSFAWKTHDNEMITRFEGRAYEDQLREWVGLDVWKLSLEEYAYWTGLLQGEGLTEFIDNYRRRSATTSAAVFWMYNDCWPTVRSWTIVDHRGRRTPSFHPVRRAFAPVRVGIVDAAAGHGEGATVWVHNDTQAQVELELEAGTASFAGVVQTDRQLITVPPRETREVASLAPPHVDGSGSAYLAVLRDGERVVSRNRLLPGTFAELPLVNAEVRTRLEFGAAGERVAVFEADAFVLGVALDLDGEDDLADDFFDLYPGVPHRIPWTRATEPRPLFTANQHLATVARD